MSYEETFCILQPCFVYRIPPRSSTQGYKAADWNLEAPVWQGRITVKAKGGKCFAQLEDSNTNQVFAVCHIDPENQQETVEAVLDSSRYYVLKIEDEQTKRHAFIGMGFHERDQSFEFKAALQDYKRRLDNERRLREAPKQDLPALNLTLKEGETIKIDLKTGSGNFDDEDEEESDDLFLPPPPSGNKKISAMSTKSRNSPAKSQPTAAAAPAKKIERADPYGLLDSRVHSPPVNSPSIPHHNVQPTSPIGLSPLHPTQRQQQQQQPQQSIPTQYHQPGRIPLNQMRPGQAPPPKKEEPKDPFANLVNF